jgi:hypothetical protein
MCAKNDETEIYDHVCNQRYKRKDEYLWPSQRAYAELVKDPGCYNHAGSHIASVVQIAKRTDLSTKFPEIESSHDAETASNVWREDKCRSQQHWE